MKTTYKDYIPETANRKYKMTNNADGTVSLDDQTVYSQTGDKVTAAVLNELSQNVVWPLTHSKSGTTHALTGLSGASGILSCQFKATAAFAAGDTVTVDGTSYTTIRLSNGEEAEDNLFVSGAVVPCIVDTAGLTVNFKGAGGQKLPAETTAIVQIYTQNDNFTVPQKGKYRITVIGAGGGSGAWCGSVLDLK